MSSHVLDASVVAAAFFQEEHAGRSCKLLTGRHVLLAPDLIYAELANVIWKRHARGELDKAEAGLLLADIRALPLRITSCANLVEAALELAMRTGRSAYDCVYLALAVKTGSVMVTADRRLANALVRTPLAKHVAWVGDIH